MAGKRYGRKGGYRKGGVYKGGKYNFTAKRRRALEKAAYISARKRKGNGHAATAKRVAVLAGVAGAAYLGYRHRGTIGQKAGDWRNAVNPWNKEKTRITNAISVAPPSQTTVISQSARTRAQNTRDEIATSLLPPHMGGPDNRLYDENDNVDTDAMSEKSAKRTLAANRRRTRGRKTESLQGTPGGRKRPPKADPANKPKESEYQDFIWENDVLVPVGRVSSNTVPKVSTTAAQVPGRTRPTGLAPRNSPRDELRFVESMRAADERLLSGKDSPNPTVPSSTSGVAPVEFKAPVMDKPATSASRTKPKAPTAGTNTGKDSNPGPKNASSVEHRKKAAKRTSSSEQEIAINAVVDNNPGMSREEAHDMLFGYPGNYRKWW